MKQIHPNCLNANILEKYYRKLEIIFNGNVRQRSNDSNFYNYIQPFQHHKTNPKDGINVYSFSINPNEFQPSGACNFSRINEFQLKIDLDKGENFDIPANKFQYNFFVYSISYNILKITGGMGAKQYAN